MNMMMLRNLLFCLLVLAPLAFPPPLYCEQVQARKVLFLNSYHAGYKGSDGIVAGFDERLRQSFPAAEITVEYLDSKNYIGTEFDRRVLDTLRFKYRNRSFDLIVSSDDYAFNVLERHRDEIFGPIPVVFCGTNDFDPKRIEKRPDFAGIDERPSFSDTVSLILELHPATRKIVVIHDDSITGKLNSANFREATAPFTSVDFSFREGKRIDELTREVAEFSSDTAIVYFASFVPGANGERISSIEALRRISTASRVPVYGGWEFNLGHGIVGGRLINLREHGRAAAELAEKVLQGKPLGEARLQPSPNQYMFDYTELQRFRIPESEFPAGSIVIKRPPTFLSRYGFALMILLSAALLLLVLASLGKLLVSRNELRASEARYRGMIEAFDGFMHICSADYRVEFMNERLIEKTGYDATGRLCYKALHDLDEPCPWCRDKQVPHGESRQRDVKDPRDGRWYHVFNTSVENAYGKLSRLAMITDITERKEAEEALHLAKTAAEWPAAPRASFSPT